MKEPFSRKARAYRPILEYLESRILLSGVVGADFNGDGFADLAMGLPEADVGGVVDAGLVRIQYGSDSGLIDTSEQLITQNDLGQGTLAEEGDFFGAVLAAGDFNGDGFADLAVGVANDDFGSGSNGGVVHVLYGSATGLTLAGNQLWSQDSPGVPHVTTSGDLFGRSLAVGDFNGDGFDDLCVGMPGNNLNHAEEAGGIIVIHGSASGLTGTGSQTWDTRKPGIKTTTQAFEHFGASVAAGDFNGDGFDDVAIGVPDKDWSPIDAGVVIVIYGSEAGLTSNGNQVWSQNSSGIADSTEEADHFGGSLAAGDFNGDGYNDLVVGVPGEDIGTIGDAGVVHVIFGTSNGLHAANDQLWSQDSTSILDLAETGDMFGFVLGVADFNGDGLDDMAIGAPFEDMDSVIDAGAIHILYGSTAGPVATGNQFWSQNDFEIGDGAETDDHFGAGLAGADFNGDGFTDLAVWVPSEDLEGVLDPAMVNILFGGPPGLAQLPPIIEPGTDPETPLVGGVVSADFNGDGFADLVTGIPQADVAGVTDAGAIRIQYGSALGLVDTTELINQNDLMQGTVADAGDLFGLVLAAGDFNGDGFADLAIGVGNDDFDSIRNGGVVHVLYGSAAGLTVSGNQLWSQDSLSVPDATAVGDLFGRALTVGDFNGDGFDDLAIGMPGNDSNNVEESGSIIVLHGTAAGLTGTGSQAWDTGSPGITGSPEPFDHLGASLAAGDFNGDGFDDVAIGVPDRDSGAVDTGAAVIIYGSAAGLTSTGDQIWSQNSTGILDSAEEGDHFAAALAIGDFNGDGFDDLAIGVPGEDDGATVDVGRVNVILGSATGLTSTGNQLWHQDVLDVLDDEEAGDGFGTSLAAGDFNGDGFADLAIGVPYEDFGDILDAGGLHILNGAAAGLSATGNQFWSQDSINAGDNSEAEDQFGAGLAAADFNGDFFADLAVWVPGEDLDTIPDPGTANILHGGAPGLSP